MDLLKKISYLAFPLLLNGCQFGYFLHSAKGQISILSSKVEVEKALQDEKISEVEKQKIRLAQEARQYAVEKIGLVKNKNYSEYVKLTRPYVTYVVSAAEKKKLKQFEWDYPIVGKMPYKGFFDEGLAKEEEQELIQKGYDTFLRGVSAYSTLGWFQDPLLSSMTNYRDDILVNTIIHETVHATLYIKNSADFNERMAVFIANKATEEFYFAKEGASSATVASIRAENADENLFSGFISHELRKLEAWYLEADRTDEQKSVRLAEIKSRFQSEVLPKLKTKTYSNFAEKNLNNARLLLYKTYVSDLADFEKLFVLVGQNYGKFIDECRKFEKSKTPEQELKKRIE